MITNTPAGGQQHDISFSLPILSNRIQSLDVLRGIAVLGALVVSIWVFGGFSSQQQNQLLLTSKGWNYRVFGAIELLLTGKMRALIALVFGAAMILFFSKKAQPGSPPAGDVFIKRQLWLILFGLVNALVFLWTHDVLFHLGIMGILLFPFMRLTHRGLLIAAIITTFIYCGKNYWAFADKQKTYNKYLAVTSLEKKYTKDSNSKAAKGRIVAKDTLTKLQKKDKAAWEGLLAGMKVDLKKDDPNKKAMRSVSYGKVWNHVLPATQSREAQWTYQFGIWDFAGMIFLGMALFKIGFFNNRYTRQRYLLFSLACLTGGLLLGWFRVHFQQVTLQDLTKYLNRYSLPHDFFFPLERSFMVMGYASLVIYFLTTGFLSRIWKAFSCVGKLALTNYLVQSLLCTLFFYGYGMGYYGRLTQWELYFIVAEIVVVQIVFSVLWLRYYTYGPAEWLLRRLSYGKDMTGKIRKPVENEKLVSVIS